MLNLSKATLIVALLSVFGVVAYAQEAPLSYPDYDFTYHIEA